MRREVSSCGRLVYTYIRYSNRTWQMRSCTRISPLHYITFCLILKAAGCTGVQFIFLPGLNKGFGRVTSPRIEGRTSSREGGRRSNNRQRMVGDLFSCSARQSTFCQKTMSLQQEKTDDQRFEGFESLLLLARLAIKDSLVLVFEMEISPFLPLVIPAIIINRDAKGKHRIHIGSCPLHPSPFYTSLEHSLV